MRGGSDLNMVDLIVYVAVGLISGGIMGYVMGRESPRRCLDCLSNDFNRYKAGHKAGYQDGVADAVKLVRTRSVEARNTYTITKDGLERIQQEMAD